MAISVTLKKESNILLNSPKTAITKRLTKKLKINSKLTKAHSGSCLHLKAIALSRTNDQIFMIRLTRKFKNVVRRSLGFKARFHRDKALSKRNRSFPSLCLAMKLIELPSEKKAIYREYWVNASNPTSRKIRRSPAINHSRSIALSPSIIDNLLIII